MKATNFLLLAIVILIALANIPTVVSAIVGFLFGIVVKISMPKLKFN